MQKNVTARHKKRSEKRNKIKTIGVRVTEQEHKKIKSDAKKLGVSMSAFLLAGALEKKEDFPSPSPVLDRVVLTQILGQLGKVGSNLNQIAKRMNVGGHISTDKVFMTCDYIAILKEEILKAIRGGNGH